jgi:GntR family transcriptional regulator of vanillate catabolism
VTSQRLRAVLSVRQLILEGELVCGARIAELPLAARLGLSRTPLRLALAQLEAEGLLESGPHGGFAVRCFDRDDIADAIEVRGVLEGTAARLAAERLGDPAELEAMHGCVGQLDALLRPDRVEIADFERYVQLNERFHQLLAELSRSAVVQEEIERVNARPFASPSAFVRPQAELSESHRILIVAQSQHRGILEALERGQGTRAEALAREHARLALGNLDVALASRRALAKLPGAGLIRLAEAS